jgi:hypothetical protein
MTKASDSPTPAPADGDAQPQTSPSEIPRPEISTTTVHRPSAAMRDGRPIESLSTAELIRQASEQLSVLVRDELALARIEMTRKAKRAGLGAGLFGAAGVISLYGVFGILTGVVLLIARVIPAWGAALAVGGLLVVIAGILGLAGGRQLKRVPPPVPRSSVALVREDVQRLRTAVHDRGAQR